MKANSTFTWPQKEIKKEKEKNKVMDSLQENLLEDENNNKFKLIIQQDIYLDQGDFVLILGNTASGKT